MFNMADFLKENLIEGYWNGSFNKTQVNLFAFSYLSRGQIEQKDFDYIIEAIQPQDDEEVLEPILT